MDIDEEYSEHIKISSEYAICSNSTKNINDQNFMCCRLLADKKTFSPFSEPEWVSLFRFH